jgi:hypothetical protein
MNEFVAKKLGEVLAFAVVGKETFEKGKESFVKVLGAEVMDEMIAETTNRVERIQSIVAENHAEEIVNKKLEGTGKKLREMRDLYVADQWDNPTELLEWSGFFEGAAIVHWALVEGAAEALNHHSLKDLSKQGKEFHEMVLKNVEGLLNGVGQKRAIAG